MKPTANRVPPGASSVIAGSASEEIFNSEEYAKFVESMVSYCHCAHDRPCDGVLAGGLCDNIHDERDDLCDDDRVSLAYETDDLPAMDRPEDF